MELQSMQRSCDIGKSINCLSVSGTAHSVKISTDKQKGIGI